MAIHQSTIYIKVCYVCTHIQRRDDRGIRASPDPDIYGRNVIHIHVLYSMLCTGIHTYMHMFWDILFTEIKIVTYIHTSPVG